VIGHVAMAEETSNANRILIGKALGETSNLKTEKDMV